MQHPSKPLPTLSLAPLDSRHSWLSDKFSWSFWLVYFFIFGDMFLYLQIYIHIIRNIYLHLPHWTPDIPDWLTNFLGLFGFYIFVCLEFCKVMYQRNICCICTCTFKDSHIDVSIPAANGFSISITIISIIKPTGAPLL